MPNQCGDRIESFGDGRFEIGHVGHGEKALVDAENQVTFVDVGSWASTGSWVYLRSHGGKYGVLDIDNATLVVYGALADVPERHRSACAKLR